MQVSCDARGSVRHRVAAVAGRGSWLKCAVLAILLSSPAVAQAAGITVAWNANPEANIDGYAVLYRSSSGSTQRVQVAGGVTTTRIENLSAGVRYYVRVVAISDAGLESAPSAEVNGLATDPAGPPAPPSGAVQTYFAEGATGIFNYRLALMNTTAAQTTAVVSYLREGASPVYRSYQLAPRARATALGSDVPELQNTSFAAVVSAVPGVIAERTMRWRLNGSDGASSAKALVAPATQWFLAEGEAAYFDTFVLLANPGASAATATVDFLLDGGGLVRRTYSVGANQRFTIWTNQIPELAGRPFATTVRSNQPILVERAMYFKGPHGTHEGGHASAAVTAGARNWFLAEGATGDWFETFVLISNPNASSVTATVQYLTPGGVARTDNLTLPPNSRTTILVDSLPGLQATEVSCSIAASANIIVERSMYWPGIPGPWYGGHNSVGITTLRPRWAFAEGELGGVDGADSFVLLANPGATAANVTLTYYRASGQPVNVTRTVAPRSRVTVAASSVGLRSGDRFGLVINSSQPIAAERSVYWNYQGALWTSGTNETGTAIP